MAPPGSKQRRKLAVIFQSLVKFEEFLPFKELIPSSENFKSLRIRNTKIEYKAIKIIPKTKTKAKEENILSLDDLDVLEFLTKSLFIHYGSNWVDILK